MDGKGIRVCEVVAEEITAHSLKLIWNNIKITFDTNCFFDYYERNLAPIEELIKLQEQRYIEIAMTTRVMADTLDKWKGEGISPIWKKIQSFPIVQIIGTGFRLDMSRLDSEDYLVSDEDVNTINKLTSILAEAQTEDIDHLFGHIKANRDIFVSSDKHFLNYQEQLKQEFGVMVLDPNNAIQQIKKSLAIN